MEQNDLEYTAHYDKSLALRKKRRRKKRLQAVLLALVIFIALIAAVVCGLLIFSQWQERNAAEEEVTSSSSEMEIVETAVSYTEDEVQEMLKAAVEEAMEEATLAGKAEILNGLKASLLEGTTVVETLRPYYPNEIVLVSSGQFHFVPINRELAQNSLDPANLNVLESGEYQYLTDNQVTSHKGIDVSSHQGKIDWEQVAADGVEFAIIRVGFRGYGSGKLVEDEQAAANLEGATAAGIPIGVYFFSQATTEEEVLEEVEMTLQAVEGYDLALPIVYDVEKVSGDGRMNAISVEDRTAFTKLFCDKVQEAGYDSMIYFNTEMAALLVNIEELEDYKKWYASYSEQMFFPYDYTIWQYSDKGSIAGISTAVDLNISFSKFWEE